MKLFCTLILTIACYNAHAFNLKVSTFNIRWFGLGGTMEGSLKDEKRGQNLKDFLNKASKVSQSDVIALQEIVDQEKIKTFFPQHSCTGYSHANAKHQFVMLCVKKPLKLVLDGDDDNFIWEDVADITIEGTNMRLRPAVHGVVQDANGVKLAHVVSVHLKAEPEQTAVRIEQIRRLKKHMDNDYKDKLPTVIAGDFNAHVSAVSKLPVDDYLMMGEIFKNGTNTLKHIDNLEYTYRSGTTHHTLDHYWISSHFKASVPAVWPECKKGMAGTKFMDPKFYLKEVSDHCPVTVELSTK